MNKIINLYWYEKKAHRFTEFRVQIDLKRVIIKWFRVLIRPTDQTIPAAGVGEDGGGIKRTTRKVNQVPSSQWKLAAMDFKHSVSRSSISLWQMTVGSSLGSSFDSSLGSSLGAICIALCLYSCPLPHTHCGRWLIAHLLMPMPPLLSLSISCSSSFDFPHNKQKARICMRNILSLTQRIRENNKMYAKHFITRSTMKME